MSNAKFQVVYDGPALEGSTIDVRDLAPALLAFGCVIEEANMVLNEGKASVSLRVNASFKSGCFGIDFAVVQSVIDQILGLVNHKSVVAAKDIVEGLGFIGATGFGAYKGLIHTIKWIRNRKITRFVILDNGNVRIECNEDHLEVEKQTVVLLQNFKLRQAFESAITKPLVAGCILMLDISRSQAATTSLA